MGLNFTLSDAKISGFKARIDPLASIFSQLLVRTIMVDLSHPIRDQPGVMVVLGPRASTKDLRDL